MSVRKPNRQEIEHSIACLDYLSHQARRGVVATGDGDTADVQNNSDEVRAVLQRSLGRFVCLRGLPLPGPWPFGNVGGNKFFTDNNGKDPTKLADGTVAYTVIGYAEDVQGAQMILYGRSYPTIHGMFGPYGREDRLAQ